MRTSLPAAEIQKIVQQMVNEITEVKEDTAEVFVTMPRWHETDSEGCNWDISTIRNGSDYVGSVSKIIQIARTQYLLKDE